MYRHNVPMSLADRYGVDTVKDKAKVLRAHLSWLQHDATACAKLLTDAERVRMLLQDMRLTPAERHAIDMVIAPLLDIEP